MWRVINFCFIFHTALCCSYIKMTFIYLYYIWYSWVVLSPSQNESKSSFLIFSKSYLWIHTIYQNNQPKSRMLSFLIDLFASFCVILGNYWVPLSCGTVYPLQMLTALKIFCVSVSPLLPGFLSTDHRGEVTGDCNVFFWAGTCKVVLPQFGKLTYDSAQRSLNDLSFSWLESFVIFM